MEEQERVEILGKTTSQLLNLGFWAHQIGYRYLREAVLVACQNPCAVDSVTKLLYPEVAKRFETTDKQVERAIRNSIETAWVKGNRDAWNKLSDNLFENNKNRPTNTEVINALVGSVIEEN